MEAYGSEIAFGIDKSIEDLLPLQTFWIDTFPMDVLLFTESEFCNFLFPSSEILC